MVFKTGLFGLDPECLLEALHTQSLGFGGDWIMRVL